MDLFESDTPYWYCILPYQCSVVIESLQIHFGEKISSIPVEVAPFNFLSNFHKFVARLPGIGRPVVAFTGRM